MKIVIWLIQKIINFFIYVWLTAAMIPLLIGIIMIDILLKLFKVDKVYLLLTDFNAWLALINEYIANRKNKQNRGEKINYV